MAAAAGLLATLVVPAAASLAAAEPAIAFLNPSSFALAGERGYVVSDAPTDSGPDCCAASDGDYRFSAWVSGAPAGANVFFTVVQGALDFELPAVKPAGDPPESDTWEASWDIPPEILDGPAEVTAYVVLDNEAIAQTSVDVTILRVEPAIDLAYPVSGGSFGTFAPLASALPEDAPAARKKPLATVDALYTATLDMAYVRTFYTTSPPGSEPEWKPCATEAIGTNNNQADNGVRCTLADATDAASVTAVGAVANDSPNDYDPRFNESGDAVRVTPYAQLPSGLVLDDLAEQRVEKDDETGRFFCSAAITATVTDQLGRVVPGANVDAEAVGPTDSLKFHTSAVLGGNVAPDRGNHGTETAYDCTGRPEVPPPNASPGKQGEHALFGSPDPKHVESAGGGTTDRGTLGIRFYSNASGLTQYTVWTDEADDGCAANDDRFTFGEPAAAGSIGWESEPETTGFRTPVPITPCRPGGEPSPEPTEPGGPATRSVSLRASEPSVPAGDRVRLSGRIRSDATGCLPAQDVALEARRPGRRFRAVATTLTRASGRYRFTVVASRTRDYRAVVASSSSCAAARSPKVRVRTS